MKKQTTGKKVFQLDTQNEQMQEKKGFLYAILYVGGIICDEMWLWLFLSTFIFLYIDITSFRSQKSNEYEQGYTIKDRPKELSFQMKGSA